MKKWNKSTRGRIAGIMGILIGLYIIFQYENLVGLLPMAIGSAMFLWRYNGK